jgi:hypothetical protein
MGNAGRFVLLSRALMFGFCGNRLFPSQGIDAKIFENDGNGDLGHQGENQKADGEDGRCDLDLSH